MGSLDGLERAKKYPNHITTYTGGFVYLNRGKSQNNDRFIAYNSVSDLMKLASRP